MVAFGALAFTAGVLGATLGIMQMTGTTANSSNGSSIRAVQAGTNNINAMVLSTHVPGYFVGYAAFQHLPPWLP